MSGIPCTGDTLCRASVHVEGCFATAKSVQEPQTGVHLIVAERLRQLNQNRDAGGEGHSLRHDDGHEHEELARAAATYALPYEQREARILNLTLQAWLYPRNWRFSSRTQPGLEGDEPVGARIRDLVKAGALCAAEIDRLQRTLERK